MQVQVSGLEARPLSDFPYAAQLSGSKLRGGDHGLHSLETEMS